MASSGRRFRYEARHPVSGTLLDGNLRLVGPSWSRFVSDNGTLEATIAVPRDPARVERLRPAVEPLQAAWYIKEADSGRYVWGGPVLSQSWDRPSETLKMAAMEWRGWFYKVPIVPNPATGRDILYRWTNTDQVSIARQIAAYVLTDPGSPANVMPAYVASGKLRDFSVYGSELKSVGELIDSIAQRAGGFEWSVEIVDVDGEPRPQFTTWYPQRGGTSVAIQLRSDTQSGKSNLLAYDSIERSGEERYSRFWATGAGTAPDVVLAADTDPALAAGGTLRFEGSAAYSSVTKRTTVAEYARAGRLFYAGGMQTMTVTVPIGAVGVAESEVGDRASLRIRDRWVDIDLPAVRVIQRTVDPEAGSVALLLDLSDSDLPTA